MAPKIFGVKFQKIIITKIDNMFEQEGILRAAMEIYLSMTYEENADYSEESMTTEYLYLRANNELHLIFDAVELYYSQRGN